MLPDIVGCTTYGLKGTMSEMEVAMFRQRSQEAIRQKARRGEYYTRVPEGYVLLAEGRLEKDPDERVRTTMELLFEKFRELGSARQVHLWFHQEDIKVPRRVGKTSGVEFTRLLHKSWHVVVTQAPAFSVARAWRSSPSSLSLLFIDRIALPAGRMMRPAR